MNMKVSVVEGGSNAKKRISIKKLKEMIGEKKFKDIKEYAQQIYQKDLSISIEFMESGERVVIELIPRLQAES